MPAEVRTYCPLCVAHCGLVVTVEGETIHRIKGDAQHPISSGYTCPKGRSLALQHDHPSRLNTPQIRSGEDLVDTTWDESLRDINERLARIVETHGPEGVAMFIGTGGSHDAPGARAAVKFMRALGSPGLYSSATIDAPAKPVVAEMVTGNAALYSPMIDFDATRLTLLIGTNPLVSHGHTSGWPNPRRRLQSLKAQGEVWVIDPRLTETAAMADHHLAPRAGTDHVWLAALVKELLASCDRDALASRASGVDRLEAAVDPYDLASAAETCALNLADLEALRDAILRAGKVAIQTGTGVTMTPSAPLVEWLVWAAGIITESVDSPGGVWFNPGFLHAHDRHEREPGDASALPGPASRPELPRRYGETPTTALTGEIRSGKVKALFVLGGNLLTAVPATERFEQGLSELELLVVIDILPNPLARAASHVLPAVGALERAGVPYATDTYLPAVATQYSPRLLSPGHERKPAWWMFGKIAEHFGHDLVNGLDLATAQDDDLIRPLLARSGITLEELKAVDGPAMAESPRFGWVSSILSPGGWRIAPQVLVDRLASDTPADGLVLIPQRQLRQLNSQFTHTGTSDKRKEEGHLSINPLDAAEREISSGELVTVTSAHGSLPARALHDDTMARGCVSIPHGHTSTNVNRLTSDSSEVDLLTGMPMFSGVPVTVTARR